MEEHTAIAINLEAEFAGFRMMSAETGAAIGADIRTHPPADVSIAVVDNLDAAVSHFHRAIPISSQTRAQVSHPA